MARKPVLYLLTAGWTWFGVQGSGLDLIGFRVQGLGLMAIYGLHGSGFRVAGLGFEVRIETSAIGNSHFQSAR